MGSALLVICALVLSAFIAFTPPSRLREYEVLQLLASYGPSYGLQLVERSAGRLKRGTIYVTLSRLEDRGLIVSHEEPGGLERGRLPRRVYRLTDAGRKCLTS